MILIRKAKDRGRTQTNWLDSYHTFSFADYYDENFLGFGNLLVINEDTIKPNYGFGMHLHQDMEIITYVVKGAIAHQDSLGQSLILKPGEIQRMSAGQGIRHSESNPSADEELHLLQIWILPKEKGLKPSYEQKRIPERQDELILIGSQGGGEESVTIHQDVNLYSAKLSKNNSIAYVFDDITNYGWLQLVKGSLFVHDEILEPGDGVAIIEEDKMNMKALENAEFLFFDFKKKTING